MLQFVPVRGRAEDYPKVPDVVYLDDSTGDSMAKKYNYAVEHYVTDDAWYCFRHDDLTIDTPMEDVEWFLEHRVGDKVAVCGVIGTMNLEDTCHWWMPHREVNGAGYIQQAILDEVTHEPVEPLKTYTMADWPGYHEEMAIVDGCVLFIHKKLFDAGAKFDVSLRSFHFYDVDICLQALERGFYVATLPIVVTHVSDGRLPPDIGELRQEFFAKWNPRVGGIWPINRYTKFH